MSTTSRRTAVGRPNKARAEKALRRWSPEERSEEKGISAVVDQLEKVAKKQRARECDLCNAVLKRSGKPQESGT